MCELFGINSKQRMKINNYLKIFYSHSEKHNFGWGLACFYGNAVSVEKEATKANASIYLKQRIAHPIVIDNAIAHIRLATVGSMVYENCHPFVKRDNSDRCWTLAHNGTIFNCPMLDKYRDLQEGKTDSERILLCLIDNINVAQEYAGRPLSYAERFSLLENLLVEISPNNKINLLIWDSEYMYVHCNYANTLFVKNISDETKIFSTQMLDYDDNWKPVDFLKLTSYKDGVLIDKGTHTTTEYFNPEKDWEYKNYDYSYL